MLFSSTLNKDRTKFISLDFIINGHLLVNDLFALSVKVTLVQLNKVSCGKNNKWLLSHLTT